jgi:uncharacterized membrane protein YfcA
LQQKKIFSIGRFDSLPNFVFIGAVAAVINVNAGGGSSLTMPALVFSASIQPLQTARTE